MKDTFMTLAISTLRHRFVYAVSDDVTVDEMTTDRIIANHHAQT